MVKMVCDMDKPPRKSGFTLTELIVAMLILSILSVGALGYQYVAARDVRSAEAQAAAARLAKMILDGWKGLGVESAYDPIALWGSALSIAPSSIGPSAPTAPGRVFTVAGRYRIQIDNINFYVTCASSAATPAEPHLFNVTVAWRSDYGVGDLDETAGQVRYSAFCTH